MYFLKNNFFKIIFFDYYFNNLATTKKLLSRDILPDRSEQDVLFSYFFCFLIKTLK